MSSEPVIELPVGRARGFVRGALWGTVAVLLVVPIRAAFERLNFVPTAFSNRLVDYSFALVIVPVVLLAILCFLRSLRGLLLAVWPGSIGVFAGEDELTLRLGPFGTRRFDTRTLDVRYPFEMPEDADEGRFEALLPEDEQRSNLLPRMFDAGTGEEVDRLILRFVPGAESDLATRLRPLVDRWRELRMANGE